MRFWTTVIGQRLQDADNTRSMLLCAEMLRRGHEVTMWTSAYDHIAKKWRDEYVATGGAPWLRDDGLIVRFMKGCGYTRNVSPRRFVDHWLAARDFLRQATKGDRPDAIVASIPDHFTASAAVRFGQRANVPVLVDVRDKWPDVFLDATPAGPARTLAHLVLSGETRRVRMALRRATAILGMMNSMRDWGLIQAGRKGTADDRVFFLTTSPKNFDLPGDGPPVTGALAGSLRAVGGKTVFVFVGTFNRTQHPLLLIDALDLLAHAADYRPDEVAFVIGGEGIGSDQLRARARVHANVHLVGWLDSQAMAALLRASDVGLLLTNFPTPAFNNKAFSYISSGLPIINCATGDLAELIDDADVGINVRGGDAGSVAAAITALSTSPQKRSDMSRRMRTLFDTQFDRQSNYANYADHVEAIAARPT